MSAVSGLRPKKGVRRLCSWKIRLAGSPPERGESFVASVPLGTEAATHQ
jgi:hypothetical protein